MQLYHEYSSVMHTNTYIVVEGGKALVVDPGDNDCAGSVRMKLDKLHASLEAIVITHAHFDHIAGVAKLKQLFEDVAPKIYMHKEGAEYICGAKNLGKYMGVKVEPFEPDVLLEGGETLNIIGLEIKTVYTPGHSKDGMCYILRDKIFTGDTLFFSAYGRTDLYDGDFDALKRSVQKLFELSGNYVLLPGHGEPTTLEFERRYNPILNDDGEEGDSLSAEREDADLSAEGECDEACDEGDLRGKDGARVARQEDDGADEN